MSETMKDVLSKLMSLSLLTALSIGVFYQIEGLVSLVVTAYWVIALLALVVAISVLFLSTDYEKIPEKPRKGLEEWLIHLAKKSGVFSRCYDWIILLAQISLLGLYGCVVTAVFYSLTSFILHIVKAIAREMAIKYGLVA